MNAFTCTLYILALISYLVLLQDPVSLLFHAKVSVSNMPTIKNHKSLHGRHDQKCKMDKTKQYYSFFLEKKTPRQWKQEQIRLLAKSHGRFPPKCSPSQSKTSSWGHLIASRKDIPKKKKKNQHCVIKSCTCDY